MIAAGLHFDGGPDAGIRTSRISAAIVASTPAVVKPLSGAGEASAGLGPGRLRCWPAAGQVSGPGRGARRARPRPVGPHIRCDPGAKAGGVGRPRTRTGPRATFSPPIGESRTFSAGVTFAPPPGRSAGPAGAPGPCGRCPQSRGQGSGRDRSWRTPPPRGAGSSAPASGPARGSGWPSCRSCPGQGARRGFATASGTIVPALAAKRPGSRCRCTCARRGRPRVPITPSSARGRDRVPFRDVLPAKDRRRFRIRPACASASGTARSGRPGPPPGGGRAASAQKLLVRNSDTPRSAPGACS